MPNYVVNILKVEGADERRMEQIKAFVRTESHEENKPDRVFDFQKIVPMPEDLSVIDGGDMDIVIALYKRYCRPDSMYSPVLGIDEETFRNIQMTEDQARGIIGRNWAFPPRIAVISEEKDREWLNSKIRLYEDPENIFGGIEAPALIAGHRYVMNKFYYGSYTWYDWCRKYWGTKWNGCDPKELEDGSGWRYETAWTCSDPIVRTLSVIFPDVSFDLRYADEDIGSNCGMICYQNGEKTEEQVPANDKEAVEFAVRLWEDTTPEEAGYRWDETSGRYRWNEDDE